MFIEGPLKSGKTSLLTAKYLELINSDVLPQDILVICANKHKQSLFFNYILNNINFIDSLNSFRIHTFNGIVYNFITKNWAQIEQIIPDKYGYIVISPDLCSLETTEFILKNCINEINRNSKISDTFKDYFNEENLVHQLLRRYRLITENLVGPKDLTLKSHLLNQTFAQQADWVLNNLKSKTNYLRTFDFIKQINIFTYCLKNNLVNDFQNIKYLLADDLDEQNTACYLFIEKLLPQLNYFALACDVQGGARRGYLCAYPWGWDNLKNNNIKKEIKVLKTQKQTKQDALNLFNKIKNNKAVTFERIKVLNSIQKAQMTQNTLGLIENLITNKYVNPRDIVIIAPNIDESVKFYFSEFFDKNNIKYQFITGTQRLYKDKTVFCCVIICQLLYKTWKMKPTPFELKKLFSTLFNFSIVECEEIINNYTPKKELKSDLRLENETLNKKYHSFIKKLSNIQIEERNLSFVLNEIVKNIILPELIPEDNFEFYNLTVKSLETFENIREKENKNLYNYKDWVIQIKNTVVSDTPVFAPNISDDALIISTPQKIVDLEIESDYQIWYDVTGYHWTKDDTGPLYNSWVFSQNWDEQPYTQDIHEKLTIEKTAHLIRKLVLCANKEVYCLASSFDAAGYENNGILKEYLLNKTTTGEIDFNFIPRDDQQDILNYKGGKLAVPAVPGAGKTTILQALIIKLLKENTDPSRILVLTYMESAAKNILERIKKSCPNLEDLPQISTIHSLALSIIRDNENFIRLGLSPNLEVCDDSLQQKLISEICFNHLPTGENLTNWITHCSDLISYSKMNNIETAKLENFANKVNNQTILEFLPVYKDYLSILKERELLDFDDLLNKSIELLKNNSDIRRIYQDKFKYIIEDEAQDSSKVQQELINILYKKHQNIIRTGDLNQAITTTFSNADVQGFKNFISISQKIEMTSSQRCAKPIYELANNLVDWASKHGLLKNAFYKIKMKTVQNKNPVSHQLPIFKILETQDEEKQWTLEQIHKLKKQNENINIGILVRNNQSVTQWAKFFDLHDISYLCFGDSLNQKKVFRLILGVLEVLVYPFNNKKIINLYKEFINNEIFKHSQAVENILAQLGTPFIKADLNTLIEDDGLNNFQQDLIYWTDNSSISVEHLILKIGNHYFKDIIDRSNVELFSLLAQKHRRQFTDFKNNNPIELPEIVQYFKELSYKTRLKGIKLFDENENNFLEPEFIKIMTVHKSKGMEFDAIFVPEMHENNYSYAILPQNIVLTSRDRTKQQLLQINNIYKTEFKTKLEIAEEHLRLIYVAITRAKKYLYLSTTKTKSIKSTNKESKPHSLFGTESLAELNPMYTK